VSAGAPWQRRFNTERYLAARVAKQDPDRGVVTVQSSENLTLATWDVPTGAITPTGIATDGFVESWWLSADGAAAFILADDGGDELGHVERVSLDAPHERVDLTPDLARYTLRGGDSSLDGSTVVFAPVNADGFWLVAASSTGDGAARIVNRTPNEAWRPCASADGRLAAVDTTEHNPGVRRWGVTAFDIADAAPIGSLTDSGGGSITAISFSPVLGDPRVLVNVSANPGGFGRPALWNPVTGERTEIRTPWDEDDVEVLAMDWSPDGSRLLLGVQRYAEQRLAVHELASGTTTLLDLPAKSYWLPMVRQSVFGARGAVLAMGEDADTPLTVLSCEPDASVRPLLAGAPVPTGAKARSVTFDSEDGTTVQAWLLTPPGEGPFPTVLHVHGGPHWFVPDSYNPEAQAWVEHGYAWLDVNFRGSTGRGSAFIEQITGDLGRLELQDMAAAHEWLTTSGTARPDAIFVTGESYGGFLTLYGVGRQPELWAGGFAVVAIADWAEAYRDASAALQAAMRSWFGGSPQDCPDIYRDRSPVTYAEDVRVPVVVLQGERDSRTAPAQMRAYEARLRELGKDLTLEWFAAGHGFGGGGFSEWAVQLFVAKANDIMAGVQVR
jgi:dipeptidyl aminopeptidase/acylaminoacyl peptidase